MVNIIHKEIYSNRLKTMEEFEPYEYKIEDPSTIISFMIFLSNLQNNELLIDSLKDFCETKRVYMSEDIENHIIFNETYYENSMKNDLKILFKSCKTIDILDFFCICINNIEIELNEYKKTHSEYEEHMVNRDLRGVDDIIESKEYFIKSLNETFEHNNLGYQVINGIIANKKSDFLHSEVISKPLTLLINEEFNGPLEEFKKAVTSFTHKDYEKTVIEACKAFESTMKAVLDKLNVAYDHDKPTASGLISLLKENSIFDSFQDDNLNKLTGVLMGLPTIRNRKSGHGDGMDEKLVERSYASLALNLAGSYIVFILDRYYETIE